MILNVNRLLNMAPTTNCIGGGSYQPIRAVVFLTVFTACTRTAFAETVPTDDGILDVNVPVLDLYNLLHGGGLDLSSTTIDIFEISSGLEEISQRLLSPPTLTTSGVKISRDQNVSLSCLTALTKSPSIQALDAFGKPSSGILGQNFNWLGNMDECVTVNNYHHCVADMQLELEQSNNMTIKEPITWGVCLPSKCSENDIEYLITDILEQLSIDWFHISSGKGSIAKVHCAEFPPKPYDAGFICVVTLCSILGVLMLLGAAVDVYTQFNVSSSMNGYQPIVAQGQDDEQTPLVQNEKTGSNHRQVHRHQEPNNTQSIPGFLRKFLLCFAVNRSLDKCLNAKQGEKTVGCLNGIRVLSMCWVILAHSLLYPLSENLFDNTMTMVDQFIRKLYFTVVLQGSLAVDSFFFLSGFLLAYLSLDKMAKTNGKLPWGLFYVHRYLRLTPVYGSVILFLLFIDPYISNGPLWYRYIDHPSCETYWWRNLIYISNLFPKAEMCMDWSWYLPNDMQFFAISPVILILLYRRPKIGVALLSTLTLISIIIRFTLLAIYNSPTLQGLGTGKGGKPGYWDAVYDKPYTRVPPYFVGIALGFFIANRPHMRMRPTLIVGGWMLASAVGLVNVYVLNDSLHHHWGQAESVIYNGLSPFIWSLCLCWVVLACKNGYGGWINTFLSWKVWEPLGRLTYTVYLVHPIIIRNIYFSLHSSIHAGVISVSTIIVSNVVLCHGVALVFTLAVEFPCANLEKWLLSSFVKTDDRKTHRKDQDTKDAP